MMGSKLSTTQLGKIWDLSDIDRDGFLTRYEFTVAMHLTYRALQVSHNLTWNYFKGIFRIRFITNKTLALAGEIEYEDLETFNLEPPMT